MTYKYSQGRRKFGDIKYEGDTNTEIDFEDDYIALEADGVPTLVVSGSNVGIGTTTPSDTLTIEDEQPCIQLKESNSNRAKIFINNSDHTLIIE